MSKMITEKLEREIIDYAEGRKDNVKRGLESPRLAALLLEKFAWGVSKAIHAIEHDINLPGSSSGLVPLADRLCSEIDPDFEANRKRRYDTKPSDLNLT